jgi:serine/threonine protein phosphatase PrpC
MPPAEQAVSEAEPTVPKAQDDSMPTAGYIPSPTYGKPHPKAGTPRGLPAVPRSVPDTVLDGADLPGMTVRAASLRGDDHRYGGEPRQDSMGIWTVPGRAEFEVLVVCVADGVGSELNSHRGSELACALLRDELATHMPALLDLGKATELPSIGQTLATRVAAGMHSWAEQEGVPPKSLSTTFVAAVIEMTPLDHTRDTRRGLVFGVGDSSAFLLRDSEFGPVWSSDLEESGQISSSRTNALPTSIGGVNAGVVWLGHDDTLVVCTDGLVNPMRNADVERQLATWWSRELPPGLMEFGWQLGFRAKSFGDDRTAVCVWGR